MANSNPHPHPLVSEADVIRRRYQLTISAIASERMEQLAIVFATRHPGLRLICLFGNGIELVRVLPRGADEDDPAYMLDFDECPRRWMFIRNAVEDVIQITDGYADGCPENVDTEVIDG